MLTSLVQYCIDGPSVAQCFSKTQKQSLCTNRSSKWYYNKAHTDQKPYLHHTSSINCYWKTCPGFSESQAGADLKAQNHTQRHLSPPISIHRDTQAWISATLEASRSFPFTSNGKRWKSLTLLIVKYQVRLWLFSAFKMFNPNDRNAIFCEEKDKT